ncbi:MAG: GPP34 family phosphoprotein, partial [Peptostreptococcaceae bacterium]|nr:GPP34 family phosphoprotein [Peptostreptococcaceae bacterium]
GKLSSLGNERALLVGAALSELLSAGVVRVDDKGSKIYVEKELGEELAHLEGVYRYLNKKQRTIDQLAADYCISFTDDLYDDLLDPVCKDLVTAEYVECRPRGILGNKRSYIPKPEILEEVRSQILPEKLEAADEKQMTLAFLLDKANRLKKLFDKDEVKAIREQIKKQNADHAAIQKIVTFLDELMIVLATLGAMSV